MKLGINTRYAPSPTGNLHIGGARTALFNYLLAKKQYGKFILRVEDTDSSRNIPDAHLQQEKILKLLQIFPDESFSNPGAHGPYLQSQKQEQYLQIAYQLVRDGKAYLCNCPPEDHTQQKNNSTTRDKTTAYSKKCRNLNLNPDMHPNACIRLKVDGLVEYEWNDLIRGNITIPSNSMSDLIIVRSDRTPTYNFAVVVDDIDMNIDCVLRGEEHLSNTAYQLAIYHALEKPTPQFGHLSVILNQDGKKMSKREKNPDYFIENLIANGYSPSAIINFLALLGWSYKEEEIFSIFQLKSLFNLESVSKSPALFDIQKLNWISHKWFQQMDNNFFLNFVRPFFTIDLNEDNSQKINFALACKDQIIKATELNDLAYDFFIQEHIISESGMAILKDNKNLIQKAVELLPEENSWDEIHIRHYIKHLSQLLNIKGKALLKPLRIAFTKKESGIDLCKSLYMMGRVKVAHNLQQANEIHT